MLCGCEAWILTKKLIEKLDIYARSCYRIMIGIKRPRDHETNQSLYQLTSQVPLRELTRERHLKFIGHCIGNPSIRRTRSTICHLRFNDQLIFSTSCTKDDTSQSNFVPHSTIWPEISRSRRNKKDGVKQI